MCAAATVVWNCANRLCYDEVSLQHYLAQHSCCVSFVMILVSELTIPGMLYVTGDNENNDSHVNMQVVCRYFQSPYLTQDCWRRFELCDITNHQLEWVFIYGTCESMALFWHQMALRPCHKQYTCWDASNQLSSEQLKVFLQSSALTQLRKPFHSLTV